MPNQSSQVLDREDPEKDLPIGHVKVTKQDWLKTARDVLVYLDLGLLILEWRRLPAWPETLAGAANGSSPPGLFKLSVMLHLERMSRRAESRILGHDIHLQ